MHDCMHARRLVCMTARMHEDMNWHLMTKGGAYNRSLTPFGFQSEQRTFWEAPEIYFEMSPFMHAHKVNEPILLIHGDVDNNSGTFPVQSRSSRCSIELISSMRQVFFLHRPLKA